MTQATDNVTNCVADLASDKSEVDYMVCTLKDKALLDVAESGMGGREAVVRYLKDSCEDKVATSAFLVLAVDDRGNTRSVRRKYIHYIWIGPKTPVMAKAKVASQSGKFKEVFAKTLTLSIQTDNLDDFAEAKLEGRLRAAGGAHQPTSFDFSNSSANAVSHTMGAGAIASAGAPVRAAPPSATSSPSEAAGAIAAAKAQGSTFKVPAKEQVKAEEPAGVELDDPVDEGVAGEMDTPVENENEDM